MKSSDIINPKSLVFLTFLNAAVIAVILFFTSQVYLKSDDTFYMLLTSGCLAESTAYVGPFISTHFAGLVSFLFHELPGVNWYTILFYFVIFLSSVVINKTLLNSFGLKGYLIHFSLLLGMWASILLQLQWTLVAFVSVYSGLFYVLHIIILEDSWRKFWKAFLVFTIGIIISSSIRHDVSMLAILLASPIIFLVVFKRRRSVLKVFLIVFLCVFTFFFMVRVHRSNYSKENMEFTRIQEQLLNNNPNTIFNKNNDSFTSLGFSSNDIHTLKYFLFLDEDVYSIEKLKKLSATLQKPKIRSVKGSWKYIKNLVSQKLKYLIFPLMITLFAFMLSRTNQNRLYLLINFGVVSMLIIVFVFVKRLPTQVFLSLLFGYSSNILFYVVAYGRTKESLADETFNNKYKIATLLILFISGFFLIRKLSSENSSKNKWVEENYTVFKEMEDKIFFTYSYIKHRNMPVFKNPCDYFGPNFVVAGYHVRCPIFYETLNTLKLDKNIFKSAYHKKGIVIVHDGYGDELKRILQIYVDEHYPGLSIRDISKSKEKKRLALLEIVSK